MSTVSVADGDGSIEHRASDGPDAPDATGELGPVTHSLVWATWALFVGLGFMLVGAGLRLWNLMAVGFNSDEAVYSSQAAGIAGDSSIAEFFPIFRAHPFLFQAVLSVPYQFGTSDTVGRLVSVAFGCLTSPTA